MILVDTSVWIDHLRRGDAELIALLNEGQVMIHPFVIGELALGNLQNRDIVISTLHGLPKISAASEDEVLYFLSSTTRFTAQALAILTHTYWRLFASRPARCCGRATNDFWQ